MKLTLDLTFSSSIAFKISGMTSQLQVKVVINKKVHLKEGKKPKIKLKAFY